MWLSWCLLVLVFGSCPHSKGFFSGSSAFPSSAKTNIPNFSIPAGMSGLEEPPCGMSTHLYNYYINNIIIIINIIPFLVKKLT